MPAIRREKVYPGKPQGNDLGKTTLFEGLGPGRAMATCFPGT